MFGEEIDDAQRTAASREASFGEKRQWSEAQLVVQFDSSRKHWNGSSRRRPWRWRFGSSRERKTEKGVSEEEEGQGSRGEREIGRASCRERELRLV